MKYLVVLILFLSSCSAQWHLKKAIQKNPDLLRANKVIVDTLIITDSFFNIDTFTLNEIDTFITDTGKVKITLYKFRDRYTLKTEIEHDTIHFQKEIPCPASIIQIIDSEKMKNYMLYSFLAGCLVTSILLILYNAKKLDNAK